MEVVCEENEIKIRYLEKNNGDIETLCNWLNTEDVYKYYGSSKYKSVEFIREKYGKRIDDEDIYPCIIEYNGKSIGYVQFYKVNLNNYDLDKENFEKLVKQDDIVYAIDIFLAEDINRNKGIGTKTLKLLIKTLLTKYKADTILIDPKTNNLRAIKCYKKCGFQESFITKKREEHDGIKYDNIIMKIKKEI